MAVDARSPDDRRPELEGAVVNWGAAAVLLVCALALELIAVELLRSIIHRKRERRDGLGGTQDIAMWGTAIGWLLLIAGLVCGVLWFFKR